jgi:hypothetical protein
MTDIKFGGCPSCGKASCVALACQELSPEHVAWLEKRLEAFAPFAVLLQDEKTPPKGLPFGIIDPDYARIFTQARCIAWQYGYTCVMHGSFTRDLDLLLVPWTKQASGHETQLLKLIAIACNLTLGDGEEDIYKASPKWTEQPHGRRSCSLYFKEFGDRRWVDLSVMPLVVAPKPAHVEKDGALLFPFNPNELTALSNSPIALMALVNWWHCRETEDSAFSGERVDYKARREELTARAKAIVSQDPDCWPEDLAVELGLYGKSKFKAATWYPIDGNLRGYDGDIVVKHKDGSHRVGATNWISSHKVKTPRGAVACWQSCLKDGYVSWTPLG